MLANELVLEEVLPPYVDVFLSARRFVSRKKLNEYLCNVCRVIGFRI